MAFWRGQPFWINRYNTAYKDKPTKCPSCGQPIFYGESVAVIEWAGDDDQWTLMHPKCAENSDKLITEQPEPEVDNRGVLESTPQRNGEGKRIRWVSFRGRHQREAIIAAMERPGQPVVMKYDPDRERGKRWTYKVKPA